jgi:very-short-patch-repair endonuclease
VNFQSIQSSIGLWINSVLQHELDGEFTHRIVRSHQILGASVDRNEVVNSLLTAQSIGELAFRGRKWSPRPISENINDNDDVGVGRQKHKIGGILKAIDCSVLSSIVGEQKSEGVDTSSLDQIRKPNWAFFKTLLSHYRECLHLGGASSSQANAKGHKMQFHLLDARERWWPDDAGVRPIRISTSELGGPFLEALSKRFREPILLGYPISVGILPDEERIVTPVCILQCSWHLDDLGLTITPLSRIPILNPQWLKYGWKRKEFRRTLKRLADLMVDEEDTPLSLRGAETWSDVSGLSQTLSMFLPSMIHLRIDPSSLQRHLSLDIQDNIQNSLGLFLVSENNFTKGCRSDLTRLMDVSESDLSKTALSSIFSEPLDVDNDINVVSPLDLGEDQFLAVNDGLSAPVTVVSGPPGTGKSQVVASIMLSAAAQGKNVLFSSHNHKAIDAVFSRIDSLSEEHILCLRANGKEESGAIDLKTALDALLNRLKDPEEAHSLAMSLLKIKQLNHRIDHLISLSDNISEATNSLGRLWVEKASRERVSAPNPNNEQLLNIDVSWWQRLKMWLSVVFKRSSSANGVASTKEAINLDEYHTKSLDAEIATAEKVHKACVTNLKSAEKNGAPLHEAILEVTELSKKLVPLLAAQLEQAAPDQRDRLIDLAGNVGLATTSDEKLEVWRDKTNLVLNHFPLWTATTLAVPGRLPLVPGMFDYLIIDEATTANIAETFPLLYRSKRVIVVGDRMQTGMISDLNPAREAELLRKAGVKSEMIGRFSFSQISLFDFFNNLQLSKRHILRDHFRCSEDIAGFFSNEFYKGRLLVRTDPKALKPPKQQRAGYHWTDIVGPIEKGGTGAVCEVEAVAIADHLVKLIKIEGYKGTLGVVSPFKKQAELIRRKVEHQLSIDEIRSSQLIIDTAHKFQGDARDVVLISLCYSKDMPRGAAWFLGEGTEWLNVAVSRARAVCHIFGNRTDAENTSIRHIRNLARYTSRLVGQPSPDLFEFESPWERRLFDALKAAGIDAIPQYPLAGRRLDLAVIKGTVKLDVEVDGETYHRDPDGFRKTSDLWRDHVVSGLGWRVCRFWVYELRENMEKCVERVGREIGT